MLRIKYVFCVVFTLLIGCSSQSGQGSSSNNFNQLKAAKTRISLGLTYLKNGNYSQAKFNLDKAMEFAPRAADANYAMAYYYQKVGEIEKAEDAYQFAMDLEPKNADIINSYGAFLCQNGQYGKAKENFLKAVNTSNYISSAETYENLALCSESSGHPEDAVSYLRSAVNHQPGRGNSLYLLAQALIKAKQWAEARDVLRRYEKIAQVSPQSLLMAIEIEKGSGNYATAKSFRDMLIKVYPSHPEVIALLKDKESFASTVKPKPKKVQKVLKKSSEVTTSIENIASSKTAVNTVSVVAKKVKSTLQEPVVVVKNEIEALVEIDSAEVAEEQKVKQPTPSPELELEPISKQVAVVTENVEEPSYHIVAKGENLYRISLLYNIKLQRLVEWNQLSDASAIYNGMKLKIVAPDLGKPNPDE